MRWFRRKSGMSPNESTRFYGGDGTIHATQHVDVEIHDGEVVSVWFRCQPLAFLQTRVGPDRAAEMRRMYDESDYRFQMDGVTIIETREKPCP